MKRKILKELKRFGENVGLIQSRGKMTRDVASRLARFGNNSESLDGIVKREIAHIEEIIKRKSLEIPYRTFHCIEVQKSMRALYAPIEEHFKERGFTTRIITNELLPELGPDNRMLFISWDQWEEDEKI